MIAERLAQKGLTLLNQGRTVEALSCLEEAILLKPSDSIILYHSAIAHQRLGNDFKAIENLTMAIEIQSDFREAYTNLAQIFSKNGDKIRAYSLFKRANLLNPEEGETSSNLAVLETHLGYEMRAGSSYCKALKLSPFHADIRSNYAYFLMTMNLRQMAMDSYRTAVVLSPDRYHSYKNGSALYIEISDYRKAIELSERALLLQPNHAESLYNKALSLKALHFLDEARYFCRQALLIEPHNIDFLRLLGHLVSGDEAKNALRQLLIMRPDWSEAWNNFALICLNKGDFSKARESLIFALRLTPSYPEAQSNLSIIDYYQGALKSSFLAAKKALILQPQFIKGLNNFGIAALALGFLDLSIETFRKALIIKEDYAQSHYNLGCSLLKKNLSYSGWSEYEWRWRGGVQTVKSRQFDRPQWQGEPLTGKRLFIHSEQGYGDIIQFSRFLPLIDRIADQVIFECPPELLPLLMQLLPRGICLNYGEKIPSFDYHMPIMSAPYCLKSETITATSYLKANDRLKHEWLLKFQSFTKKRVGLVWAGASRPHHPPSQALDKRRSLSLIEMIPLLKIKDIQWISLQKDQASQQIEDLPPSLRPFSVMNEVKNFNETAAIIDGLDLVITIDSSIAHLAGSLGVTVWLLNRYDGCWRWLKDQKTSPWYSSMRIFNQEKIGDWSSVIAEVRHSLLIRLKGEE